MPVLLTGINRVSGFSIFCEESFDWMDGLGDRDGTGHAPVIPSWPCGWKGGHVCHLSEDPVEQQGSDDFLLTSRELFFLFSI